MKKTLLTIFSIGAFVFSVSAQTYTPAAGSPLAGATQGMAYAGQTINADIPTTVDIDGQAIIDILPSAVQGIVGGFISAGTSYPITVTSTVLTVEGLPAGLTSDCNGCTVNGGSDRDIVISGTPTEGGSFTINVTSATTGSASIQGQEIPFGGTFTLPIVGTPVPVPALPGVMNAEGYTMSVMTGIEEANDIFSLNFYPNPTEGNAILDVNSRESGIAAVEVYSITGSQVLTFSESIRVGVNRVAVDLSSVPGGIYLIKADINGAQALIRTQKI
ncbi:MAG: T9SS type A sorting domain-containing protein [Flavobacteriales bacterium]|nr:T9SS type A sorting domain-containing protein [Flavobacteriales bacterium]